MLEEPVAAREPEPGRERRSPAFEARGQRLRRCCAQLLVNEGQHVFGLGVTADQRLGEDERAIQVDVEDALVAHDHLDGGEVVLVLQEQARGERLGVGARTAGTQSSMRMRCMPSTAVP
jgi:hypothetical protein